MNNIDNREISNHAINNYEINDHAICNNEINNQGIIEAIGLLDDDLIEETRRKRDAGKSRKGIHMIRKFGVVPVAACIVLIIGSISVYAAARLAGILKVHEGTSNSEKDLLYTYEIPDGYKKIPMSEITGKAVQFADSYLKEEAPDTETETLNDRMLKRDPKHVYFDSIEDAADYIGYQSLNIEPFRVVGKRALVTLYLEKTKEQGTKEKDESSEENARGNYVLGGLELRNVNGFGSTISQGIYASSIAFLYTENSSVTPSILGGVLSAAIKPDSIIYPNDLPEELKEKIENGISIQDYDNIDEELPEFEFSYGVGQFFFRNGSDNKVDEEKAIVNDREFEIVTVTSKLPKETAPGEDKTNLDPQFVMAYQKCVIHVENDIIYTLNVSYGDEEKNEAEEIVRKWMNSF